MRKSFLLRINPELWNDLSRWAADDLRSVNGLIEFLLRDAVEHRRGKGAIQRQRNAEAEQRKKKAKAA
jgi:hypothetical protein